MTSSENPYRQAHTREKAARLKAEQLLEEKSRELYQQRVELEESYKILQQQEATMLKTEKLATLGTLSAGIAHEINNPLTYVISNMESLHNYTLSFQRLFRQASTLLDDSSIPQQQKDQLISLIDQEDLGFISKDIDDLLQDTEEGLQRVLEIINNLRSFSRTRGKDEIKTDLLIGLKSTIKILDSELRGKVNLKLDLQPIPKTLCNPNELNQVFLNLIINAKQATEGNSNATVEITSDECDGQICICIKDNGCGMPDEVVEQIFVPFFTTKPVGKGTGMGLAVAYGIIKDHQGQISVASHVGSGTTFEIKLPVKTVS